MRRRNRLCGGVGGNVLGEYSVNAPERAGERLLASPRGSDRAGKRTLGERLKPLPSGLLDLDAT